MRWTATDTVDNTDICGRTTLQSVTNTFAEKQNQLKQSRLWSGLLRETQGSVRGGQSLISLTSNPTTFSPPPTILKISKCDSAQPKLRLSQNCDSAKTVTQPKLRLSQNCDSAQPKLRLSQNCDSAQPKLRLSQNCDSAKTATQLKLWLVKDKHADIVTE